MPIIIIPTKNIKKIQNSIVKSGKPLLEIITPNVYLGALKRNEWDKKETIIVRFIEGSGVTSKAQVKINEDISKVISEIKAVDLLERQIEGKFDWNKKTGILTFNIGKFEICTFELFF